MAVLLVDCVLMCTDFAGGADATVRIANVDGDGFFAAHNCLVEGYGFADIRVVWADVHYWSTRTAVSMGTAVTWDGGSIRSVATATITVTNAAQVKLTGEPDVANVVGGSVLWSITATGTATVYLDVGTTLQPGVTIASGAMDTEVHGHFSSITCSGNTNGKVRRIVGQCAGQTDVTGPCNIDIEQATAHVTIRGAGVNGRVRVNPLTNNPALNYLAATHSHIDAHIGYGGSGGQAYAFDSSSHNNLLVLGGTNNLISPTVSTDAGTANRVITELGDYMGGILVNPLRPRNLRPAPPAEDGEEGEQGPPGIRGRTGARGATGATGPAGPAGSGKKVGMVPPADDPVWDDGPFGADPMLSPAVDLQRLLPVGSIILCPFTTADPGFMLCQGGTVSRKSRLGVKLVADGLLYGTGDGSTTVNVPDWQERFPLGKGATHALGAQGGATTHSHTVGTLANATSAVTGITGNVGSHQHTQSTSYAQIAMNGTTLTALQVAASSYTDTIKATLSAAAESVSGKVSGVGIGGATDATTPSWAQSGSGTAAAQVISGSTATVTGPVDQFTTINYQIKL